MERLTDIIARVEKLAFAREEERQASASVLQPPSSEEQPTYPLLFLSLNHPSFLNTSRRRPFLK